MLLKTSVSWSVRLAEDIFSRALRLTLPIHFLKLAAAQSGRMTELPAFVSWEQQGVYHLQVNNSKLLFKQICIHSLDRNPSMPAISKAVQAPHSVPGVPTTDGWDQ